MDEGTKTTFEAWLQFKHDDLVKYDVLNVIQTIVKPPAPPRPPTTSIQNVALANVNNSNRAVPASEEKATLSLASVRNLLGIVNQARPQPTAPANQTATRTQSNPTPSHVPPKAQPTPPQNSVPKAPRPIQPAPTQPIASTQPIAPKPITPNHSIVNGNIPSRQKPLQPALPVQPSSNIKPSVFSNPPSTGHNSASIHNIIHPSSLIGNAPISNLLNPTNAATISSIMNPTNHPTRNTTADQVFNTVKQTYIDKHTSTAAVSAKPQPSRQVISLLDNHKEGKDTSKEQPKPSSNNTPLYSAQAKIIKSPAPPSQPAKPDTNSLNSRPVPDKPSTQTVANAGVYSQQKTPAVKQVAPVQTTQPIIQEKKNINQPQATQNQSAAPVQQPASSVPSSKAPAPSTPAFQVPSSTPAVQGTASSTPVVQAPAPSAPAVQTPAPSTPVVQVPSSTPAVQGTASSTPAAQAPAPSAPAVQAPAPSAPAAQTPISNAPAVQTPGIQTPSVTAEIPTPSNLYPSIDISNAQPTVDPAAAQLPQPLPVMPTAMAAPPSYPYMMPNSPYQPAPGVNMYYTMPMQSMIPPQNIPPNPDGSPSSAVPSATDPMVTQPLPNPQNPAAPFPYYPGFPYGAPVNPYQQPYGVPPGMPFQQPYGVPPGMPFQYPPNAQGYYPGAPYGVPPGMPPGMPPNFYPQYYPSPMGNPYFPYPMPYAMPPNPVPPTDPNAPTPTPAVPPPDQTQMQVTPQPEQDPNPQPVPPLSQPTQSDTPQPPQPLPATPSPPEPQLPTIPQTPSTTPANPFNIEADAPAQPTQPSAPQIPQPSTPKATQPPANQQSSQAPIANQPPSRSSPPPTPLINPQLVPVTSKSHSAPHTAARPGTPTHLRSIPESTNLDSSSRSKPSKSVNNTSSHTSSKDSNPFSFQLENKKKIDSPPIKKLNTAISNPFAENKTAAKGAPRQPSKPNKPKQILKPTQVIEVKQPAPKTYTVPRASLAPQFLPNFQPPQQHSNSPSRPQFTYPLASFQAEILNWKWDQMNPSSIIPHAPIPNAFPDAEHYKQYFLPVLYEEVKAQISGKICEISLNRIYRGEHNFTLDSAASDALNMKKGFFNVRERSLEEFYRDDVVAIVERKQTSDTFKNYFILGMFLFHNYSANNHLFISSFFNSRYNYEYFPSKKYN